MILTLMSLNSAVVERAAVKLQAKDTGRVELLRVVVDHLGREPAVDLECQPVADPGQVVLVPLFQSEPGLAGGLLDRLDRAST